MQNAVLTHAKREAKWCKTQSKQVQNTGRGGIYNLPKTTNNRLLRTENRLKYAFQQLKAVFEAMKNREQATKQKD